MKPVAGSSKPSNTKSKGKKTQTTGFKKVVENSHTKTPQRRKAEGASVKKTRAQEKWMPMTRASVTALENILDLSILSCLNLRQREKEETQKHLNILKQRFLAECTELRVPRQARSDLESTALQSREENRKSDAGRKTLVRLESNLEVLLDKLQKTEELTESLHHRCNNLRCELEEEEDSSKEIFRFTAQGVLHLPAVPTDKQTSTLQEKLMTMVPEADFERTARQLGEVLQVSQPLQDAKALLVQAHRYADQVLDLGS